MGNYSYLNNSELTGDFEKIEELQFAKKVEGGEHNGLWDHIEFEKVKGKTVNMDLGWDGFKIQGYWYRDCCEMLYVLQQMGVRGEISMWEEQGQDFVIKLMDDFVGVEFYEFEKTNDDGEILNESELEKPTHWAKIIKDEDRVCQIINCSSWEE